jgi:hypothetical protein
MNRYLIRVFAALAFVCFISPVMAANWAGSIRCELSSTASGYSHQETQTWTISGGVPTKQGAFDIYPATWTVTGQGTFDRSRASNRRIASWTASVQQEDAPVSFHVTPAGRLMVQLWHSQLSAFGGYTGPDRYINDGVPQPEGRLVSTTYEWSPPKKEVSPSIAQISGSQTTEVKAQLGPLQPPESRSMVTCSWALGQGTAPALPPATSPPVASTPPVSAPPAASAPPPAPRLTGISPASLEQGVSLSGVITLTGEGTHWKAGERRVNLGQGTTNQQMNVISPTSLTLTATVSSVAAAGPRAVTVTTGSEVVTLPGALTITIPTMVAVPLGPGVLPAIQLPKITVTTRAGYWVKGQEQLVGWTHNMGAQQLFDVEESSDRGVTWTMMAQAVKPIPMPSLGDGLVGAVVVSPNRGGIVTIRVKAAGQAQPSGTSVHMDLTSPYIALYQPAGGERWVIGQAGSTSKPQFRVSHNLSRLAAFNVELSRDGGTTWTPLGQHSEAQPFYWAVTGPATSQARVRVTPAHAWANGGAGTYSVVSATSAAFTITDP